MNPHQTWMSAHLHQLKNSRHHQRHLRHRHQRHQLLCHHHHQLGKLHHPLPQVGYHTFKEKKNNIKWRLFFKRPNEHIQIQFGSFDHGQTECDYDNWSVGNIWYICCQSAQWFPTEHRKGNCEENKWNTHGCLTTGTRVWAASISTAIFFPGPELCKPTLAKKSVAKSENNEI